jgi:hypothetical protein
LTKSEICLKVFDWLNPTAKNSLKEEKDAPEHDSMLQASARPGGTTSQFQD